MTVRERILFRLLLKAYIWAESQRQKPPWTEEFGEYIDTYVAGKDAPKMVKNEPVAPGTDAVVNGRIPVHP